MWYACLDRSDRDSTFFVLLKTPENEISSFQENLIQKSKVFGTEKYSQMGSDPLWQAPHSVNSEKLSFNTYVPKDAACPSLSVEILVQSNF